MNENSEYFTTEKIKDLLNNSVEGSVISTVTIGTDDITKDTAGVLTSITDDAIDTYIKSSKITNGYWGNISSGGTSLNDYLNHYGTGTYTSTDFNNKYYDKAIVRDILTSLSIRLLRDKIKEELDLCLDDNMSKADLVGYTCVGIINNPGYFKSFNWAFETEDGSSWLKKFKIFVEYNSDVNSLDSSRVYIYAEPGRPAGMSEKIINSVYDIIKMVRNSEELKKLYE